MRQTGPMSAAGTAPIVRIERTWAAELAELATEIAAVAPEYGTSVVPIGGGWLVLCGPGLYVNRGLALWLDRPPSDGELELLEREAAAVGVTAALDITPATSSVVAQLTDARGYRTAERVSVLWQRLDRRCDADVEDGGRIVVAPAGPDALTTWQEVSALGWGHDEPSARAASDTFAAAWQRVAPDGLLLARDADTGRWLGCAVLTTRDGIATLGGMATVPAERGRGVQRRLIEHRLRVAARAGCDIAATMARPGSTSERNLVRHDFTPAYVKRVVELDRPGPADR